MANLAYGISRWAQSGALFINALRFTLTGLSYHRLFVPSLDHS